MARAERHRQGKTLIDAKSIGLVGGLGPGATVFYYQRLTKAFSTRPAAPPLFISHADVALVRRLMSRRAVEELGDYLARHVASLCRAGAQFAAISAIAPHMCAPYLRQVIDVPLLDPIDCIRTELAARQVKRVLILGARPVMESGMYGRLENWDVVGLPEESIDFVHQSYIRIAMAGGVAGSGADVEGLRALAMDAVRKHGAEIVVLAGTDLSIVFEEANCGFPALDCAKLHVDAIVAQAYGDSERGIGETADER